LKKKKYHSGTFAFPRLYILFVLVWEALTL
jgi:hypothetical protein